MAINYGKQALLKFQFELYRRGSQYNDKVDTFIENYGITYEGFLIKGSTPEAEAEKLIFSLSKKAVRNGILHELLFGDEDFEKVDSSEKFQEDLTEILKVGLENGSDIEEEIGNLIEANALIKAENEFLLELAEENLDDISMETLIEMTILAL